MNILFKVSEQTFWQILGKIITSVTGLFILGVISRGFGEAATGVFTLTLAYLSFFFLAVDFGINPHIVSDLMQENFSQKWQMLLGLRVLLGLFLTAVAALLILFWPVDTTFFRQSVLFGILAIVGFGIFTTTSALFQAKLRFDLYVIGILAGSLVTVTTIYFLSQAKVEASFLMVGYVAGWLVNPLVALFFVRRFTPVWPIIDLSYSKKIILEVWPIATALIINVLYFRVDAFMLSAMKSFTEVGVYNLSYQIFQASLVLPTFIMNSFYPLMLKDFKEDISRFSRRLVRAALLLLALSLLGVIFTFILSPFLITTISGGSGFAGSVEVLNLLSLGFPAFFLSSLLMWVLIVYKKYKTLTMIYALGLALNVILNLVFIMRYSFLGAAGVTVVSEYFILLLQVILLYPLLFKVKK